MTKLDFESNHNLNITVINQEQSNGPQVSLKSSNRIFPQKVSFPIIFPMAVKNKITAQIIRDLLVDLVLSNPTIHFTSFNPDTIEVQGKQLQRFCY